MNGAGAKKKGLWAFRAALVVVVGLGASVASGQDTTTMLVRFLDVLRAAKVSFGTATGLVTPYAVTLADNAWIGSGTGRMLGRDGVNYYVGALDETTSVLRVVAGGTDVWTVTETGIPLWKATVFASLGTPTNGSMTYCSDCTIASPCAGSGTGAFAKRLNGVWVCN